MSVGCSARTDHGRMCGRLAIARGLCQGHYARFRRGVTVDGSLGVAHAAGPRFTGADRFWSKVDKTQDCWLWVGAKDKNGYGVFTELVDGTRKHRKAHRVSFEMENGWAPARNGGTQIRHLCGVHSCVRPDHLTTGTVQDNMYDAQAHGTRGKLSRSDVAEIRDLLTTGGRTQRSIASQYGVTPAVITMIKQGKIHRTD